jgi:hypothetical protein
VHLVGDRSRDVLEAAAIRVAIGHGAILAAAARRRVENAAGGVDVTDA